MRVKHKKSGRIHEVSDDYFTKYSDTLEVLEVVGDSPKPKTRKKRTKVVTDEAPAVPSDESEEEELPEL